MTDESALAPEAGPEAFVEEPKGEQTEGQITDPAAEGEQPEEEKKSEAAKRRDRERAYRARLQTERDEALSRAAKAEAARDKALADARSIKAPSESDFADPFDYSAEKASVGFERRVIEREAKQAGEVAEAAKLEAQEIDARERAVIEQSWTAQLAEAKTRYVDFEKVALADDVPVTKAMGDLIKTSDVGADVVYFLGQNRALAAQIATLNQVEAARAIGRIEASLQQPKPRTETNAPPPISPVRGSSGASRDPDKMSFQEYEAARRSGKIR